MKVKATIVSTITLRPRMAGQNRACKSTAKTSHMRSALTTFGSDHLRTCSARAPVPEPRIVRLRIMPIKSPKVKRGNAIVIAPRLIRSVCSSDGSANPKRDGPLGLESPHLDQVHHASKEGHAREHRPGQQKNPVYRAPECRGASPVPPVRFPRRRTRPPPAPGPARSAAQKAPRQPAWASAPSGTVRSGPRSTTAP